MASRRKNAEKMLDQFEPFPDEVAATKPAIDEVLPAQVVFRQDKRKNSNYLAWEDAKEFIRAELIPSRKKFEEWYQINKPKVIPRFPYRVYREEWKSWNDWLGTDNKFVNVAKNYRPFIEACKFVHQFGFQSKQHWLDWARSPGNLPADIPTRPDLVYDRWRSWGHWLGNKIAAKVELRQQVEKLRVYYVIHHPNTPQNMLELGVEPGGLSAIKQRWEREQFDIVKLFWYDQQSAQTIENILAAHTTQYVGDKVRIAPNVWELLYWLQYTLEVVTKQEMLDTVSRSVDGIEALEEIK